MLNTHNPGRKALGLQRMVALGLPVPPFVVVHPGQDMASLGAGPWAVRPSPMQSMPGVLPTLLNVGAPQPLLRLNFLLGCEGLLPPGSDPIHALQRRGATALVDQALQRAGMEHVAGLSQDGLVALGDQVEAHLLQRGLQLPGQGEDVLAWAMKQVWQACTRAGSEHVPLIIQTMVLGNQGPGSGCGVALSRHPSHGGAGLHGEFLEAAQGALLAGGGGMPSPILARRPGQRALDVVAPDAVALVKHAVGLLERDFHAPVEVEFTVEQGRPWFLQVRPASLGPAAAVKACVDLVAEGVCSFPDALHLVTPAQVKALAAPRVKQSHGLPILGRGVPASLGTGRGTVVFDAASAVAARSAGHAVILVQQDIHPQDRAGMEAAVAVVCARGGTTSHAAVISRSLGRPCVVGCGWLHVDAVKGEARTPGAVLRAGDAVSLDAASGELLLGLAALEPAAPVAGLDQLLAAADAARQLHVLALAHQPGDEALALALGANGVVEQVPSHTMHVAGLPDVETLRDAWRAGVRAVCVGPDMVPAARLAAALATLGEERWMA